MGQRRGRGLTCRPRTYHWRGPSRGNQGKWNKKRGSIHEKEIYKKDVAAVVILLLVCAASSAAFAQKATVLRVVVVKTDDPAAYAQEIEKGRQVMKSLGVQGQTRVWQARFAGPSRCGGRDIEYPNMALLPTPSPKHASSEYQA